MEECVCLRAELSIQLRELLSAWVNQLTGWLGVNTQTPAVNSVCCDAKTRAAVATVNRTFSELCIYNAPYYQLYVLENN